MVLCSKRMVLINNFRLKIESSSLGQRKLLNFYNGVKIGYIFSHMIREISRVEELNHLYRGKTTLLCSPCKSGKLLFYKPTN